MILPGTTQRSYSKPCFTPEGLITPASAVSTGCNALLSAQCTGFIWPLMQKNCKAIIWEDEQCRKALIDVFWLLAGEKNNIVHHNHIRLL